MSSTAFRAETRRITAPMPADNAASGASQHPEPSGLSQAEIRQIVLELLG